MYGTSVGGSFLLFLISNITVNNLFLFNINEYAVGGNPYLLATVACYVSSQISKLYPHP